MPLTSDTVEKLNRLIDIFFEKIGRKARMRKQMLKLMDESEAYLYPKIRDWMQLTRKQIIRDIRSRILKIKKKSKSQILIDYVDWETIEKKGKSVIKPAYLNIMEKSGNLSLAQARIEASFDVINPRSVGWAEKYSYELITLVEKETKKGIREIVSHGLKEGKTLTQIAKDIEHLKDVGLNKRQSTALLKYRRALEAQKLPKELYLQKYTKRYDRLLRDRSKMIARTEASRSVNEGYLDSLEGTRYEEVELSMAADACHACLDLAGRKFKRSEARGMLPIHPNCRCHWIVVIPRKVKKPKVPKKPEKPSDRLISKYKGKIEEQRKLTNEIALYRRKLGNAYYRERNFVDAKKYRALMKEASAKRRYSISQMKRAMRKDLYVDKALRPDFRADIIFPDIEIGPKRKILSAVDECGKFLNKKIVGRYEFTVGKADSRAFYNMKETILLGKQGPYQSASVINKTVIHELGHYVEDSSGMVHREVMGFYHKRTKGYSLEWLGPGYGKDELTRKDKFIDAYMGKDYKGQASEILSMGLEYFYNDPYKLALKDPEYFNFVYKLVRGMLW
ncbi:hypothetical protein ES703_15965 [subsurface metagenome]